MYLARTFLRGRPRYLIRESFPKDGAYLHRDLFDLGDDPGRFIVYPGGNAFYIDEAVEDAVNALGVGPGGDELEDMFWPFVRPDIRVKLEPFRLREHRVRAGRQSVSPVAPEEVHGFDRRRVFYLKCGRMQPPAGCRIPDSAIRRLQAKSRDEIEQGFMRQEAALPPRELKAYTFMIFDLQRFFAQRFAAQSPESLDPEAVDAHFTEEVCRLNADPAFWRGMEPGATLSEYLVRYLILYFDHDYAAQAVADEILRDFMNRHRAHRPAPVVAVSMEQAAAIFELSRERLNQMSRGELARLYRRRALDLHPDQGGDNQRFARLTEAYHELLRTKP